MVLNNRAVQLTVPQKGYDEVQPLLDGLGNFDDHSEKSKINIKYHMKFAIRKKRQCLQESAQLERIFPIWRKSVQELPPETPTIYKQGMAAVTEIKKGVFGDDASFLIAFLFRCFLVAIVEPGRKVLTELVWDQAKMGASEELENHLASKFIQVEDLPKATILRVSLPEAAARCVAESHNYMLQLDPHVTPYKINKRHAGVVACCMSRNIHSSLRSAEAEKEKGKGLKDKIRRWLNRYFWWVFINEDANDFVPPFSPFNSRIDCSSSNFYGAKQIERIFVRYDCNGRSVAKNGAFTREENKMYSLFRDVDRHRLLFLALNEVIAPTALTEFGILKYWHPIHNEDGLCQLQATWATYKFAFSLHQPINDIRNYFGEETAMYFACMMHYVDALRPPACLGLVIYMLSFIVNVINSSYTKRCLNWLQFGYCIFIIIWISRFNQKCIRFESRQRAVWGINQLGQLAAASPGDPLDQNFEYVESDEARNKRIKYRQTISAFRTNPFFTKPRDWKMQLETCSISLCTTSAITILAVILLNVDLITRSLGIQVNWDESGRRTTKFLFISFAIKVLDFISTKFIILLTKYENHTTLSSYKDWALSKFLLFKFCIHFCPLLYLAFFQTPGNGHWKSDLHQQLASLFLVDATIRLSRFFLLSVLGKVKQCLGWQLTEKPRTNFYDGIRRIIAGYQEITISVGFVVLFSSVFPILPFLALFVTLFEIRSKAIELCTFPDRPFPSSAGMIQTWKDAMKIVSLVAVATNGFMVAFQTLGYTWPMTEKLFVFMVIVVIGMGGNEIVCIVYPNEGKKEVLLRQRMNEVRHDAIVGPRIISDYYIDTVRSRRYSNA